MDGLQRTDLLVQPNLLLAVEHLAHQRHAKTRFDEQRIGHARHHVPPHEHRGHAEQQTERGSARQNDQRFRLDGPERDFRRVHDVGAARRARATHGQLFRLLRHAEIDLLGDFRIAREIGVLALRRRHRGEARIELILLRLQLAQLLIDVAHPPAVRRVFVEQLRPLDLQIRDAAVEVDAALQVGLRFGRRLHRLRARLIGGLRLFGFFELGVQTRQLVVDERQRRGIVALLRRHGRRHVLLGNRVGHLGGHVRMRIRIRDLNQSRVLDLVADLQVVAEALDRIEHRPVLHAELRARPRDELRDEHRYAIARARELAHLSGQDRAVRAAQFIAAAVLRDQRQIAFLERMRHGHLADVHLLSAPRIGAHAEPRARRLAGRRELVRDVADHGHRLRRDRHVEAVFVDDRFEHRAALHHGHLGGRRWGRRRVLLPLLPIERGESERIRLWLIHAHEHVGFVDGRRDEHVGERERSHGQRDAQHLEDVVAQEPQHVACGHLAAFAACLHVKRVHSQIIHGRRPRKCSVA